MVVKAHESLCCKQIEVRHRRNHYAVIDVENVGDTGQEVYVSIVGSYGGGQGRRG